MKRSIVTLSLAALASATLVAAQPGTTEDTTLDRSLPTYPELGFDGWRNNAGESEMDNKVQIQLGLGGQRLQVAFDGYRFDAGEPTHDMVVQDYGSV